jgi:hypothetical protein
MKILKNSKKIKEYAFYALLFVITIALFKGLIYAITCILSNH